MAHTHTISTPMARQLMEAQAIRGASIIGQPGGWAVVLKLGTIEKPLGAQRTDKPRTWRSLDSCMAYLRSELSIVKIESLDASHFSETSLEPTRTRKDSAERLKRAHEAAAHDQWFREQVNAALIEADAPGQQWVSNADAKAHFATRRKALQARVSKA